MEDWINVEDYLPNQHQNVLIFSNTSEPTIANYVGDSFNRYNNNVSGDRTLSYHYSNVTHWMPLPEPPEK